MTTTSYYDIVVIGTNLSGLICAALCARKGYRVLIIGQNEHSNSYSMSGFRCTRVPHLFYGFESSPWIRQVFAELSIAQEMRHRPKMEQPFFQVVFPEHRLTMWPNEQQVEREFQREFPGETSQIADFFERIKAIHRDLFPLFEERLMLPPGTFRERREYNRVLGRYPTLTGKSPWPDLFAAFAPDHPFRSYVMAPVLFMSKLHGRPFSPLQLVRHLFHAHQGFFHVEGGIDSLRDVFIAVVRNYCGDYRPHHQAGEFRIRRNKVTEVDIANKAEVIGCDLVIGNCDHRQFMHSIPAEYRSEKFVGNLTEVRPSHYLYTINYGMKEEALVEGMCRRVFYFPTPQAPFLNEEMIFLNADNVATQRSDSGEHHRVITASVRVSAEEAEHSPLLGQKLAANITERLRRIIPFFDDNRMLTHSPWHDESRDGRLRVGQMAPIYAEAIPQSLESSITDCRSGFKNVLFGGDMLHAGLGFEGAFLGGLNLYHCASDMVSVKKIAAS